MRATARLLAVAYDTLMRRSELVALEVSDIAEEPGGAATVLVRRAKGDPDGRGATLYLVRDSVALVRAWREQSGVHEGRLFRSLNRGVLGDALDASQVPRIFKAMARRAGLPAEVVERVSGHSTRVGATQDMVAEGVPCPPSCTRDGGRPPRWSTATGSASLRGEAERRSLRGCSTGSEAC